MTERPSREQVEMFEDALLQLPQVRIDTEHEIHGGLYARTILVPAGVALTGAAHRKDHINIVHGDITVWTEDGMRRLTGHHVLPTKAGAKRAGFAHADTYWTTIVRTDLTDVESIEDEIAEHPETLQTRRPELDAPKVGALEA